jgi:hypothetical protein
VEVTLKPSRRIPRLALGMTVVIASTPQKTDFVIRDGSAERRATSKGQFVITFQGKRNYLS